MPSLNRKTEYKWVILVICALMTFVCLGFCSSNKNLYLTAITEALGIKRSLFAINDTCRFAASAIINLFFGALVQRFGVRKMTAFGFLSLLASTLLYAFAEHILLFYLGGMLLGIGLSCTTITMTGSIIRRWFKTNIGKYTGIVFSANGIGGAVAAQIITPMIYEEGDPFGYRRSYLVIALIVLLTGILAVALLRERPENETAAPTQEKKVSAAGWAGIDFRTARKLPFFYVAAVLVLLNGFVLQGINGVYTAHLKDIGMDPGLIAAVVSVFSIALTASKFLVGVLYDRCGVRVIMLCCQGAAVIAFVVLAVLNAASISLALVFALLYALALPLETLVIPLIVNDMFGSASYDKFLGIFAAMNYTGYALGSPVLNLYYDIYGSYTSILLFFSILMLITGVIFQFLITKAKKLKTTSSI